MPPQKFLLIFALGQLAITSCAARKNLRSPEQAPPPPVAEAGVPFQPEALPPDNGPMSDPEPATAHAVMKRIGVGFNLGNIFDREDKPVSDSDIRAIIDLYKSAGFHHVRIPITWMDEFGGDHIADDTGAIRTSHPRFLKLKAAIDYALSQSLYVIINTHHERWLKQHYHGEPAMDAKFANLWKNVATYFAPYPKTLILEALNEPEGTFGDFAGSPVSPFLPEALQMTRHINEVAWDAIRRSDPNNRDRIVLVMPNAQGNQTLIDDVYPTVDSLPGHGQDPYLAISVHTYDPWDFCGEDGSNSKWPGETVIQDKIKATAAHARVLGIAVHYGEYGVGRETRTTERDSDQVRHYYQLMTETILANDMAPTLWDDRGWFALVAKDKSGAWHFQYNLAPSAIGAAR